jgi:hypothetical protein
VLHDRTKGEYMRAYKAVYTFFTDRDKVPTKQILDNETSHELVNFLRRTAKADLQYVPPGMHR